MRARNPIAACLESPPLLGWMAALAPFFAAGRSAWTHGYPSDIEYLLGLTGAATSELIPLAEAPDAHNRYPPVFLRMILHRLSMAARLSHTFAAGAHECVDWD
jgi:hypothetical protein